MSVTIIEAEEENHFFSFFNFVELLPKRDSQDPSPMLYFSLGLRIKASGLGFMWNDLRLKKGVFQNPYHSTGRTNRSHGYMNEFFAKMTQEVWNWYVAPQLPKWRIEEEAWKGLVFDEAKMEKIIHAPYKVVNLNEPRVSKSERKPSRRKVSFA
jgi:hypothetical protein